MSGARLSVYAADAGLKVPFVISGHTWNSHPYIIVELEDGRQLARGEAAGVYYRAETADSMMHQVRSVASGIEAGVDRRTLRHVLPAGGARNAIDCALVDLESQRQGIPAWQCLGLPKPAPLETFLTITADTPKAMGETAATTLGQAGRIKLKLTGDASLDTERLAAVRTARPDAELAVDANCGYRPDTLAPLLDGIEAAKVRLLEQPCPPEYDAELRGLDWPCPLVADESCQGLDSLPGLVSIYDGVNIKLDKCGGVTEGLLMARQARRDGLMTMVGNMVGTSLSVAPAFLLAQVCDFADLDSTTFIERDLSPSVVIEDGWLRVPSGLWGNL